MKIADQLGAWEMKTMITLVSYINKIRFNKNITFTQRTFLILMISFKKVLLIYDYFRYSFVERKQKSLSLLHKKGRKCLIFSGKGLIDGGYRNKRK